MKKMVFQRRICLTSAGDGRTIQAMSLNRTAAAEKPNRGA